MKNNFTENLKSIFEISGYDFPENQAYQKAFMMDCISPSKNEQYVVDALSRNSNVEFTEGEISRAAGLLSLTAEEITADKPIWIDDVMVGNDIRNTIRKLIPKLDRKIGATRKFSDLGRKIYLIAWTAGDSLDALAEKINRTKASLTHQLSSDNVPSEDIVQILDLYGVKYMEKYEDDYTIWTNLADGKYKPTKVFDFVQAICKSKDLVITNVAADAGFDYLVLFRQKGRADTLSLAEKQRVAKAMGCKYSYELLRDDQVTKLYDSQREVSNAPRPLSEREIVLNNINKLFDVGTFASEKRNPIRNPFLIDLLGKGFAYVTNRVSKSGGSKFSTEDLKLIADTFGLTIHDLKDPDSKWDTNEQAKKNFKIAMEFQENLKRKPRERSEREHDIKENPLNKEILKMVKEDGSSLRDLAKYLKTSILNLTSKLNTTRFTASDLQDIADFFGKDYKEEYSLPNLILTNQDEYGHSRPKTTAEYVDEMEAAGLGDISSLAKIIGQNDKEAFRKRLKVDKITLKEKDRLAEGLGGKYTWEFVGRS